MKALLKLFQILMIEKTMKPKLLIIGPYPPPFAGPEIGTKTLVESSVLNEFYQIKHLNTTVRKSNAQKGKLDIVMFYSLFKYIFGLINNLLFFRPKFIMYTPTSATKLGWVRDGSTIVLSKIFFRKILIQFRGGHFRFFYDSLGGTSKAIIKFLINKTDKVLAQSDCLTKQFDAVLKQGKVGVFPNAISSEFYDFADSKIMQEYKQSDNKQLIVLFAGHLSTAKGYSDLLEAISPLMKKYNIRLRCMGVKKTSERNVFYNQLTGDKFEQRDVEECYKQYIVDQGLEAQFDYLGDRNTGIEKYKIYYQSDIFVLPSYSEGFSMAVLEAMAAASAVVVSRVGALPDVINSGDNGILTNPGEVEQIRLALESVISNSELREKLSVKARKTVSDCFIEEIVMKNLVKIISTI